MEHTYVGGHDQHHDPEDQLAWCFMILDLRSDGLQRTDAHCGSDNVVSENDPGSAIVNGFHGFVKLLVIADRAHADEVGGRNGSTLFKTAVLVLLRHAASGRMTAVRASEGEKREGNQDEDEKC